VPYTVKLEGVKSLGYETAFIAIANDPALIAALPALIDRATALTAEAVEGAGVADRGTFKIVCHSVGLGALPTSATHAATIPGEVTLIVRVVAETQAAALYVATTMRIRLQLGDFPGRTTTAGNFAFPLSKTFLEQGKAHVFSVWHLLPLEDPTEPFPVRVVEFPRS
jgi:hypothetical protein